MKIVILLNHLASHGGIEKIAAQKINAWINIYNYEVILITKNQAGHDFIYPISKKTTHIDLNIENKQGGKFSYFKNLYKYVLFYNKLRSVLKKNKVDIVFTTLTSIDSLIVPFVATGIPKILEFHSSGIFLHKPTWRFKKLIVEKYDAVVVLNKDEEKYYELNNIKVIPNFVELKGFNEVPTKRDNVIIAAGRIDAVKQFEHLVEIWSKIHHQHKEWEIHLYGGGSENEIAFLKSEIKRRGVEKSFLLKGLTTKLDVKMKKASIFVLTSLSDCFPMVILEAMSVNLPVISYDAPNGPRNIISNNIDGILIPLNDKVGFSDGLSKLIKDKDLRLKHSLNQNENIKRFSTENVMKQWNDLVIKLLNLK